MEPHFPVIERCKNPNKVLNSNNRRGSVPDFPICSRPPPMRSPSIPSIQFGSTVRPVRLFISSRDSFASRYQIGNEIMSAATRPNDAILADKWAFISFLCLRVAIEWNKDRRSRIWKIQIFYSALAVLCKACRGDTKLFCHFRRDCSHKSGTGRER